MPLAFLAACSSSEESTLTTDTLSDGPIQLSAGIVEGGQSAVTRSGAEDNHGSHQVLANGTKLALQVSGTWTGHSPESVVKTTTATIGAETGESSKHNVVNFSTTETLYWDDFGTADPANASTGRTTGLTIYSAAINGKTTAPTVSDWTALSWTLPSNQTSSGNMPVDKDLLISNNVRSTTDDGTYKFAERASGKLLEFRHALSKITVNLKAGTGITNEAFNNSVVKLTSNEANSTTLTEWAYTTGTVNVTTGAIPTKGTPAAITMYHATPTAGYNVTTEALVMPGSPFGAKDNENKYPIIVSANVNGNIYYITSEKIRKAINNTTYEGSNAFPTEAGKNYIINVNINNTGINVTATVTDWINVTAEEVTPKINVSTDFGSSSTAMNNAFSFYLSTSLDNGYGSLVQGKNYYAKNSKVSKSGDNWTMSPQLYWPDHNTHYQFRGVLPQPSETDAAPHVIQVEHNSVQYQVIQVQNAAFDASTFPSNLQIARPEINPATTCSNADHNPQSLYNVGICATEGKINLNFRYMMSEVEVNLSTTDGTDAVNLTNAKVEIVNVYSNGDVKLGDRGVITTSNTGNYEMHVVTGSANKRLDAIVPQTLTYTDAQAAGNVKFKITIYQEGSSTEVDDIYYADVNPILLLGTTTEEKVAPNGAWESGYHYVYNLKLSKTKINVTATLASWTTVNANQDVWF